MAKKAKKKVTTVREHPMHVPVSEKNPSGTTIRDHHIRRLKGTYLEFSEMEDIFNAYDKKNIIYPNVVKAMISSESDFKLDPPGNPKATGIAQITPETLKALQDPAGEVKDFIFKNIRKNDLKNPDIAIPMAIRWLSRKKRLAEGKLGRAANAEEIILEYKGLLKSNSKFKGKAIEKFRKEYGQLTGK